MNIESVMARLPLPWLERIWMTGNLAWWLRGVVLSALFVVLLLLYLLFPSRWLLWGVLVSGALSYFFLRHTGLAGGLFCRPVCRLPGREKRLALSFDDGPHPDFTPAILDVLREHQVKATFFLLGKNIEQEPELLARLAAEGHELASHGYSHRKLHRLGRQELEQELAKTEALLGRSSGRRPAFRPPHGRKSPLLEWLLRQRGVPLVHWNLSPKDWKTIPPDLVLERMLRFARPGAIILLHDSANALAVLPRFIPAMKERGYGFVTVAQGLEH